MQGTEHNSLLIGGLDPTGGAGILADNSVCQKMGVKPFTILTADTIQSNDRFYAIRWLINILYVLRPFFADFSFYS